MLSCIILEFTSKIEHIINNLSIHLFAFQSPCISELTLMIKLTKCASHAHGNKFFPRQTSIQIFHVLCEPAEKREKQFKNKKKEMIKKYMNSDACVLQNASYLTRIFFCNNCTTSYYEQFSQDSFQQNFSALIYLFLSPYGHLWDFAKDTPCCMNQ